MTSVILGRGRCYGRQAWLGLGLLACLPLAAVGCGRARPPLQPVRGTLFLDGTPLPGKLVRFHPEGATDGLGGGGISGADGSFEIRAVVGGAVDVLMGSLVGGYRVVVEEPAGGAADVGVASEPRPPARPVPAVYTTRQTTPLQVEVRAGKNDLQLRLESRAR